MRSPAKIEKRRQSHLEEVLDFSVELSRRLVLSGANLERVSLSVARICHAYGLEDVSIYLLSTYISLAARDKEGRHAFRQISIPPAGIQLNLLKSLNNLSYRVAANRPAPERLMSLLEEACRLRDYADWQVLLARVGAMVLLCLLFGGGWREILIVVPVTVLMYYLLALMERPALDRIVANALTMFIAAVAALALTKTPIGGNIPVIIITLSMMVIPGIPLVNAVRNLLSGFEMNGILQILKVTVETLALGVGIIIAMWLLGPDYSADSVTLTNTLSDPILLVLISAATSVCLGVVFRVELRDLWLAGLGGALTRVALILLSSFIEARILYITLSALVAALFAEILAVTRKHPSTYFVYPSIVPLIPGNLFYFTLVAVTFGERAMFESYGLDCLLTLVGLSIGFVLSSTISHYVRKMRHIRLVRREKK